MLPLALLAIALLAPPTCHVRGLLPDPVCTPGAVETVDVAVVCGTSTRERRHVTEEQRRAVLAAYGNPAGAFELDHLVPLELGGSNANANLWPEPGPDFKAKDHVENVLHGRVCSGKMTLEDAQRAIARDWTAVR